MTKAVEAVLIEALRLDTDARAEFAVELLASLDGPVDPDADQGRVETRLPGNHFVL